MLQLSCYAIKDCEQAPTEVKRTKLLRTYWPCPCKLTVCGLPPPLSLIETDAVRLPVAVGLKVTLMVQLFPVPNCVPQLFVWL